MGLLPWEACMAEPRKHQYLQVAEEEQTARYSEDKRLPSQKMGEKPRGRDFLSTKWKSVSRRMGWSIVSLHPEILRWRLILNFRPCSPGGCWPLWQLQFYCSGESNILTEMGSRQDRRWGRGESQERQVILYVSGHWIHHQLYWNQQKWGCEEMVTRCQIL